MRQSRSSSRRPTEHPLAQFERVVRQIGFQHELDGSRSRGIGYDVSAKRTDMLPRRPSVERFGICDAGDGQADAAKSFAHGNDVGNRTSECSKENIRPVRQNPA